MFVAEVYFRQGEELWKASVSIDGGTWCPQACRFLTTTSSSLFIGEKFDRKNYAIHKG